MRVSSAIIVLSLAAAPSLAAPPRDPFAPFERPATAAGDAPLQRFPLEQLRLRGVVAHTASPRALIEAPDGASHLARVGDWIGTSWGRIAAIGPDRVLVVERYRDPIGGVHENRAELKLPVPLLSAARAADAR